MCGVGIGCLSGISGVVGRSIVTELHINSSSELADLHHHSPVMRAFHIIP